MEKLDYQIVDADNHYYEPDDCFTRHIESRLKDRTVRVDRNQPDGVGRVFVADERLAFFSVGVGDHIGRPGAMAEFFKGSDTDSNMVNRNPINALEYPEFTTLGNRLKLMDEQQVEACVMIPTMGVGVEYQLRRHPELLWPSLSAFNRWMEEDWGFGNNGRVFSTPLISMVDIPKAIAEMKRVAKAGAKLINVTTGPVEGMSPADRHFYPFWECVQALDLNVVYHIGATGFCELYATPWGETANPASHRFSTLQSYLGLGERCISDTVAALIFHNLFEQFPGLRMLIIEHGAAWVKRLLGTLDKVVRMGGHPKTRWRYGEPRLKPSDTFRKHFWVVPFHEDDVAEVVGCIGTENVLNGSDYPHPEGLKWPVEFRESLEGFSSDQVRCIMRSNAAGLLGLAA